MKRVMHILFLSCHKATELMEKKMQEKLSFKENMQLKVHTSMCKACSRYKGQSLIIDKSIELSIERINKDADVELLKKQIIDILENGA